MTNDNLIFKNKIIQGNDLELIFHKDFLWIYNENPFPVIKYILINCRDLNAIKFDLLDPYDDGLVIDVRQEDSVSIFEATDMGGDKVRIICDKIVQEECDYARQDLIDLIKEFLNQRDGEYDTVARLTKREDQLKQFLNHELDIVTRKITQANWLSEGKKQFLQGQQEIIKKIFDMVDKI